MVRGAWAGRVLLLVGTLPFVAGPRTAAAAIPDSLRELLLGAGHRPIVDVRLNDASFHSLARYTGVPYLLWRWFSTTSSPSTSCPEPESLPLVSASKKRKAMEVAMT